ncbi:UNVERIFIED_CONTAM: hypothetical protein Sradi_3641900 [Sesamum radiatum]|uniref:Uncharacterized protein n=1 Tax=Sesamum radiatum TaxID=300843 RepID=A0AAW2QI15_SESRA
MQGLEHGYCPWCKFWHPPRISPWILFNSSSHERRSGVGVKIHTLSLDNPADDRWNMYFPPVVVALE